MKIKPTGLAGNTIRFLTVCMLLLCCSFVVRCFIANNFVTDFTGATFCFIGAYLVYSDIEDEFIRFDDTTMTISRKFYKEDKRHSRVDTLLLKDMILIDYGSALGVERMEDLRRLRFGWNKPNEIIIQTSETMIPWNALNYSKRDIARVVSTIATHTNAKIGDTLSNSDTKNH